MDNKTDNDLKKRINEVFENFDDLSAHGGWLLLREKYPEKKRRVIAWYWWGMTAAVLLCFFGIALFNNDTGTKPEKLSYKPIKQQQNRVADKQQTENRSTQNKPVAAEKTNNLANINSKPIKTDRNHEKRTIDKYVAAKQFTKEERTAPGKPETNNNQVIAKTGDTALSNLAKVTLPQTHGADANANIIAGANNRARTAIHKPDAIIDNDPYSKA